MSEFIEFILIETKPKTEVYAIKKQMRKPFAGNILGYIKWYGPWRQYCLFPLENIIFNMDCMRYIIDFINELMEARK